MLRNILLIALFSSHSVGLIAQPNPHWVRHPDHSVSIFVSDTHFEKRETSRLFYWSGNRSKGEIFIGYGPAEWDPRLETGMENLRFGYTWRMASGFWTTLDTSLALDLGGTRLEPGHYYLGLTRSLDGEDWFLTVMDPETIRRHRMDAFETQVRPIPFRFKIPLSFESSEELEDRLKIWLSADEADVQGGVLQIAFGPYRLESTLRLQEMPEYGELAAALKWPAGERSQGIEGLWTATVTTPEGNTRTIDVLLRQNSSGYQGIADLREVSILGVRLGELRINGNQIHFRIPRLNQRLIFEGSFNGGSRIEGTLQIDDAQVEMVLEKRS